MVWAAYGYVAASRLAVYLKALACNVNLIEMDETLARRLPWPCPRRCMTLRACRPR